MSRRHGASRRRTYAPRQRELRYRRLETPAELGHPTGWPRGTGWEEPPRSGPPEVLPLRPSASQGSV